MLSSRLTALVIPTSQKIVIAVFSGGEPVQGRSRPEETTSAAPTTWPISF